MALKEKWVDKRDNVDVVSADDINGIAHAVIDLEDHTNSVLKSTPMSLTDERKAVSRDNIGAGTVIETAASGDSITLTDSAGGALRGLNLFGKSTQQTTTGAQLASFPDKSVVTVNGITWASSGGAITVSGTRTGVANSKDSAVGIWADLPVSAGTYTISGSVTGVDVRAEITKADGTVTIWDESMGAFTLDGTETMCAIYCNVYATDYVNALIYPMLNAGTSALPWEPYTGGVAAPNPDYPCEISSVGDGGAVEVAVNDQTIVVSTPNGLPGIPVASGGNYTDEDGQMWVCDEIDFARGVYVQRVAKYEITGAEVWTVSQYQYSGNNIRYDATTSCKKIPAGNNALFSDFLYKGTAQKGAWVHPHQNAYLALRILWTFATVDELTAYLTERYNAGNPVTVYYILAEPVETALTAEQLALFRGLRTTKPTTVITNDGGVWMAVTYAADTKAYVDGENQQQALAMMDMIDASVPEIAAEAAKLIDVPEGGGGVNVSGATVGQTVKIAAVDGNGVPTAWEAVDFPEGGGASTDWRLINTVQTTEETVNILIDSDSEGNPFECDEVLIITSNLIVTATGTNYLQINKNNAYQTGKYGFFATATNNSGRHLRARVLDNLGAFEITLSDTAAKIVNPTTGWVGIVSKKWVINAVQLKSTFQAGGTLYLYGR